MKNQNLKNNRKGRPKYIENTILIKELIKKIEKNEIKNSEAWRIAGCGKTKWFELKKKIGGNV